MKIALIAMLFSVSVFAVQPKAKHQLVYKIKTDLTIDGVRTSNTFIVKEGKKAELAVAQPDGGRFTQVIANKTRLDGKPAIQMDFVVGEMDVTGNKTVISTPKILANLGEKASVMQGSTASGKKLILSAVATRVSR